jgi:dephospho-CoA kinase
MKGSIVLGFAGKIASGKSAVSRKIADALGWPYVSFGNYVRTIARQRGLDESRQTLQKIGAALIKDNCEQFCWSVLDQADWNPGQPLIIDGLRHIEVVETLRRIISPFILRVIYIEVTDDVRESRLSEEGILDSEQLSQIELHSTEVQVETLLPKTADLIVDGSNTLDDLVSEIVTWARQQN